MESFDVDSDVADIEEFLNVYGEDDDDQDCGSVANKEIPDNVLDDIPNFEEEIEKAGEEIFISPSGTKYWIPQVMDSVKISVGDEFPSIEEADVAYRRYADEVGFDVRQSTRKKNRQGIVQTRYLFCSKEGIPEKQEYDSLNKKHRERKVRNSNIKRTGCKACIKFRFRKLDSRYVVYKFEESHNHALFNKDDKRFARSRRKLKYTDYRNIYNATGSAIGGSRSHTIQTALRGGFEYVGATSVDYENARRDMITFVGIKDAQMLINLLSKQKETVPEFFFEYMCCDGELQTVFRADEISRMNYKEFGDNISFDATYRTNRHAMNFVPFIAIDNHKRSVVVGSTLISHENVINFKWVLNSFLKAHNKQPKFVITDQCAAMKQAIPEVFTESKHRLCAWHIMKKLPNKKTVDAASYAMFKKSINKLVWSTHIDVNEFETGWNNMLDDYDLHGNDWLADIYDNRHSWIAVYFKDDAMSGLMRTTSRSESAHAYFRLFASFKNDFVRFLRTFDGALDKQRNKHSNIEFANRNTVPRCVTPLSIERHASEVYTRSVFFQVQKEIRKAVFFCGLECYPQEGDVKKYNVLHKNSLSITKIAYEVIHDVGIGTYECQCNFFCRNGILCRHIFKVLLNDGVGSIPDIYIRRRWTRALIPVQIQAARARYGEIDVEKEGRINKLYADIDLIVSRVRNENDVFREVCETISDMKEKYGANNYVSNPAKDRVEALKECYGVDAPEKPDVLPPSGIKNKGSGTDKRLMGALEKAVEKNKRAKRKCRVCDTFAHHDSRNCPQR